MATIKLRDVSFNYPAALRDPVFKMFQGRKERIEEDLPVEYGALIGTTSGSGDAIFPGSPAEDAGLQAGDIIRRVATVSAQREVSAEPTRAANGDAKIYTCPS